MAFMLLCWGKLVVTYILPSNTANLLDPTVRAKHVACHIELILLCVLLIYKLLLEGIIFSCIKLIQKNIC
jgi:hypothetical protein